MPDADKFVGDTEVPEMATKYIVPGLQRGLQILRAFNRNRTEIARWLSSDSESAHRLSQGQ